MDEEPTPLEQEGNRIAEMRESLPRVMTHETGRVMGSLLDHTLAGGIPLLWGHDPAEAPRLRSKRETKAFIALWETVQRTPVFYGETFPFILPREPSDIIHGQE